MADTTSKLFAGAVTDEDSRRFEAVLAVADMMESRMASLSRPVRRDAAIRRMVDDTRRRAADLAASAADPVMMGFDPTRLSPGSAGESLRYVIDRAAAFVAAVEARDGDPGDDFKNLLRDAIRVEWHAEDGVFRTRAGNLVGS